MEKAINPWDVLNFKRKLKRFKENPDEDSMKTLFLLRNMNLDEKMLIATEISRTVEWVRNQTREAETENRKKLHKMSGLLSKEWKVKLGFAKKDNKISPEKNGKTTKNEHEEADKE